MTEETKSNLITKIIELEYEITISIIQGHRPYIGDIHQEKRNELQILRCLVFGYESEYCKKIKI